jgi:hypothetical protein
MRLNFIGAIFLIAPLLAGCLDRRETPISGTLAEDDDAYCRANGTVAPGSAAYIACRGDRDVLRDRATARADRRQRDLGESMLNNPVRP